MIIGLTGTSGSGKSTVAALFEEAGFLKVDFDEITHDIYKNSLDCINEIRYNFEGVVDENNVIDRKKLAKIVFSDKEKLSILNNTAHKYIIKRFKEILEANRDKNIILDAPLLFEANLDAMCDYTLCVTCDFEKKVERIMKRDSISREMALSRLNSQKKDEEIVKLCDFEIVNNERITKNDIIKLLNTINSGGAKYKECQNQAKKLNE